MMFAPEIIGGVLAALLGLLGFLIKTWVESIRTALTQHMQEELVLRQQDREDASGFRQEIRTDIHRIREDIAELHRRIDTLLHKWNS